MGQAARDPRAVACGEEIRQGGLQLLRKLETCRVKLHLGTVEQGIVIGGAGGNFVQLLDHLNDIVQLAFGQGEGQIPWNGSGEGGPDSRLAHPMLVGAPSAHQVAEPLNQYPSGQHIG